ERAEQRFLVLRPYKNPVEARRLRQTKAQPKRTCHFGRGLDLDLLQRLHQRQRRRQWRQPDQQGGGDTAEHCHLWTIAIWMRAPISSVRSSGRSTSLPSQMRQNCSASPYCW